MLIVPIIAEQDNPEMQKTQQPEANAFSFRVLSPA